MGVVHELMDREQLDRSHAERCQVFDERRVGDARVRSPQVLLDAGVRLGRAFDVRLVDDGVTPRRAQEQISTASATSVKTLTLAPIPSKERPKGKGSPGKILVIRRPMLSRHGVRPTRTG